MSGERMCQRIKEYLSQSAKLSEEVCQGLEARLQKEEFLAATKNMSPIKAPGPDGYTGAYYMKFQE